MPIFEARFCDENKAAIESNTHLLQKTSEKYGKAQLL